MTPIPELERWCGSWIVTSPDGRVFELFSRANVRKAAEANYQIETAAAYLGRINREIRESADA